LARELDAAVVLGGGGGLAFFTGIGGSDLLGAFGSGR